MEEKKEKKISEKIKSIPHETRPVLFVHAKPRTRVLISPLSLSRFDNVRTNADGREVVCRNFFFFLPKLDY